MRKFTLNDITPPKPTLPNNPVNRVIFVLDRSGSMARLFDKTTEDVLEKIAQLKASDRKTAQASYITIWDFANTARKRVDNVHSENASYRWSGVSGGTALNDTMCEVIEDTKKIIPISTDESVLILVLTDGIDEHSKKHSTTVRSLISEIPENWTITLIGPEGNLKWGESVGIPRDNMLFWDGRAETFGQTVSAQATGMSSYVQTRSAGGSSTQSFYSVNPNKILPEEVEKLIKLPPPRD